MDQNLSAPTPPTRCLIPWCFNGGIVHDHLRDIDTLDSVDGHTVEIMVVQKRDDTNPPVVRVHYGPDHGPDQFLDLTEDAAAALADVLMLVRPHDVPNLAVALAKGAAIVRGDTQ